MSNVLSVQNLYKTYRQGFIPKSNEVLKGVSFSIEPGKITGFLGANGAGKTTTMKCILGLAFPTSGEIVYFDHKELNSEVKQRIGFLPERPYFYDYLTGKEFLQFYGGISTKLSKGDLMDRIDTLLKQVDLFHAKNRALRDYSKGMLQKIGLAQAMIHDPDLIILDEPMAGLDPDGRYYLSEIIRETARRGTAVFFSSHLLNDAERMCENLVILKDGLVEYEGATRKFLKEVVPEIEIRFLKSGEECTEKLGAEKAQERLIQLVNDGAIVRSFQEVSVGLEKAFIKLAMKEKQK